MNKQETKKRGRPRKDKSNLIFYRQGNRIKAFNPEWGVNVNISEKDLRVGMTIYDGMGYDWTNWGRKDCTDKFYNAVRETPFRQCGSPTNPDKMAKLESDYRTCNQLQQVMRVCSELFDGKRPEETVLLTGVFWKRTIAAMFHREAGADDVSRFNFVRPSGKVWTSVSVLPTQGQGVNYSLEPWYGVIHMMFPPIFCIRIDGEEYAPHGLKIAEGWTPKDLANAILHSLWQQKGIDSCAADAPSPEATPPLPPVASEDPEPSRLPSDPVPPPTGDPDAVSQEEIEESERLFNIQQKNEECPEPTVMTEAEKQLPAQVIPEARATDYTRTWGEIKQTMISLKGLSTSKDLQAPATLSRILDTVISHEATARLTAECRAIADKKSRNEYKSDNLHVFYPSCVFAGRAGGSKKENVIGYTGIACLDFDGMKTQEDAENMRDDLFMEFPEILFCAVSASGLGVYALVMLEFDGTEAGYKDALSAAMEQFEAKGYIPDAGCSDATRARYMSSDADALSRPDAYVPKAFAGGTEGAFILPATMLRSCWTNSGRKKKGAGKLYLEEALSRIETAPEGSKDTTLTSVMGSVARLIRNYSMDSNKVYDQVRKVAANCGYCTRKTEDKIRRLGVKNEGGGL